MMHPHRRKKKKRANWSRNIRSVHLEAIEGKFGFTISGQQPCILSSIVRNSPADLCGLKSGDFLISVNGQSVWQKDHEEIVALIGASESNQIRITIADNYFSDSSDEDVNQQRFRPKYPHSKTRLNRLHLQGRNSVDVHCAKYLESPPLPEQHSRYSQAHHYSSSNFLERPPLPLFESHNVIHSPNARNNSDILNISAMVSPTPTASSLMNNPESSSFRVIVGYLGTIEMPKQIATSSKLQTVRSCIRKLRQEKRNPALVLMNILPSCLNLLNSDSVILATYPSNRLNYVSSSSDNNSKFFGLVTSAVYQDEGIPSDSFDTLAIRNIAISNSCHVFVIDTKLIDHSAHLSKAEKFNITCSKDLISNSCLEFPTNSEYICNLIRSMYSIKSPVKIPTAASNRQPAMRNLNFDGQRRRIEHQFDDPHELLMANSPHPSNHSEITTTSSNSDSGIGFHNDYANISDRILVVDFPGVNQNRRIGIGNQNPLQRQRPRPFGIVNDLQLQAISPIRNIRSMNSQSPQPSTSSELPIFHSKSKSADYSPITDVEKIHPRLTIRAMPDPVIKNCARNLLEQDEENVFPQTVNDVWYNGKTLDEAGNVVQERAVDVPDTFDVYNEQQRTMMVRSCDDIIMVMNKEEARYRRSDDQNNQTENYQKNKEDHVFLAPTSKPPRRSTNKKSLTISGKIKSSHEESKMKNESNLLHYKLSPKVFGVPRPVSMSFENLSSSTKRKSLFGSRKKNKDQDDEVFSIWGSLQELRQSDVLQKPQHSTFLEGTYSEPSLNQNTDEVSQINLYFS